MRVYTVREGDTAERIAAMDEHASCPKCSRDLVLANAHRASIEHPNGYLSFAQPLVPGEQLWIPDKWSNAILDALPRSYFDALPAPPTGLGQPPPYIPQFLETTMNDSQRPAYALAIRPGLSGVPYGEPYGPYGISYGLAQAAPAAPDTGTTFGSLLAKLPAAWPFYGLALGGALALTGIVLMATKK